MSAPTAKTGAPVNVATSSTLIAAYNPSPPIIHIVNAGTTDACLAFATTWGTLSGYALGGPQTPTAVLDSGILLKSGGSFAADIYCGPITGVSRTSANLVTVAEF
jgi:hypothetical protein